MPAWKTERPVIEGIEQYSVEGCSACRSALRSPGRDSVVFLLLDTLTVPVIGCREHLEQLRSICAHTTRGSAELLEHRPAGGIPCPGCRLAPSGIEQPVIPVGDGAVAVLACRSHCSDLLERFDTGLRTRQRITTSLDTSD